MNLKGWKDKKGKIGKTVAKTLFFNTVVTVFMFYLVLRKRDFDDFFDVFIISSIIAIVSYNFAKIATNFIRKKANWENLALITVCLLIGSLAASFLSYFFLYFRNEENVIFFFKNIFIYTFSFGIISEGGFLYYFYSRKEIKDSETRIYDEEIKRLTLEKETALTTMKLLQAQIEPHFLFNTLSNIASLLDTDLKKAKKMLMDLNAYLRISLQRTRKEMMTLDQELELVSRYLDIFKVRMGKRLIYEIKKIGDCSQIPFPPMILQPLVENAIKYGLEPKKDGGCIRIECRTENNYLKITISDTGLGVEKMNDMMGIGLNNISKRLETLYGGVQYSH